MPERQKKRKPEKTEESQGGGTAKIPESKRFDFVNKDKVLGHLDEAVSGTAKKELEAHKQRNAQ